MAVLAALVGIIFLQLDDTFVGVQDRLDDHRNNILIYNYQVHGIIVKLGSVHLHMYVVASCHIASYLCRVQFL